MKILMVSHAYVVAENQRKLETLAGLPHVDLTLLVPYFWKDQMRQIELERVYDSKYKIVPAHTGYNGRLYAYFYHPLTVAQLLHRLKPDIVHLELEPPSLSAFEMCSLSKMAGSKVVFFTFENVYRSYRFPKLFLERGVLTLADYAISGNNEGMRNLIRKGFRKPMSVLPQLGVDPHRFCKTPTKPLRQTLGLKGFVIGFAGRLVREKGILTLLEAVARQRRDVQLLIVGRGPLREEILKTASRLGLRQRTVMVDSVLHSEIPLYLNCMDVLVLPSETTSVWKEQFGHVLIEAMACEVPVVGSNSGAIPEVIGEAGLIFEEGNVDELASQLGRIMDAPGLKNLLGWKGRERVLKNYTHDIVAQKTHQVYEELMANE
jgi:glycosyltransferase involved in cell wall biosynthesis